MVFPGTVTDRGSGAVLGLIFRLVLEIVLCSLWWTEGEPGSWRVLTVVDSALVSIEASGLVLEKGFGRRFELVTDVSLKFEPVVVIFNVDLKFWPVLRYPLSVLDSGLELRPVWGLMGVMELRNEPEVEPGTEVL